MDDNFELDEFTIKVDDVQVFSTKAVGLSMLKVMNWMILIFLN